MPYQVAAVTPSLPGERSRLLAAITPVSKPAASTDNVCQPYQPLSSAADGCRLATGAACAASGSIAIVHMQSATLNVIAATCQRDIPIQPAIVGADAAPCQYRHDRDV